MPGTLLSRRLQLIKPSATLAVNSRALQLKAEGRDIINLGAGEPDFDTPEFIKEAARQALATGKTKYTAVDGTPELKAAICRKFSRENGLNYTPNQISVGNGGKQVLYNALMATLNPGDEVIIPAPYWTSYPEMVLMAEGVPVIVDCPLADRFKLTPEKLASVITLRTKWLILNSPSNPSGVAYTRDELHALGEVLLAHPQVHVMSDDIYEHVIYDGFEFATLAQVTPELYARTLVINGVSKAYSMTGWRIGYGAGSQDVIKAMSVIQSQSTSNPCSISQAAAVAALDGDQSFLKDWMAAFKERRDMTVQLLDQHPLLSCDVPEGAFYVFPTCLECVGRKTPAGHILQNDTDIATYLLEEAGVAVVPGVAFGSPNHFRISYAIKLEQLKEACGRITQALDRLS